MLAALVVLMGSLGQAPPVDLSGYRPECGVALVREELALRAQWKAGPDAFGVTFRLVPGAPLLGTLEAGGKALARDLAPGWMIATGARVRRPGERYIFFDKPAAEKNGPVRRHQAQLDLRGVKVTSEGSRVTISFDSLRAGPFSGTLDVHLYSGSPLVHLEAALSQPDPQVAYIYDAVLDGDLRTLAWKDPRSDAFVREAAQDPPRPIGVRYRTILAESEGGTVALFPPPHAFFFPRDHTDNFKFVQGGKGRFGLRQDPDQKNAFVPWFDAPPGSVQRMGVFLLLQAARAEETLEPAQRYTNGDSFRALDGRLTYTSHWHLRLTASELGGQPTAAGVARTFKAMGVNLVHLAEFHGDGHPQDPGPRRLPELRTLFEICRQNSDARFGFLPGEEANVHLGHPAPPGRPPGHWLYLFPKPVYLTLVRPEGAPLQEEIPPYGRVYHAGSEEDMVEILRREGALAWTAHPRIKASYAAPDVYKDKDWYRSDLWLGGAWKAMPADLSLPRLGTRVLDLLDEMNTWGPRKLAPGEVDTFELDPSHELYGHMNINYLRLGAMPSPTDWSPVLGALRRGDFFVTTGEVLIHSFNITDGQAVADLEWTLPLAEAELVTWSSGAPKRRSIPLPETTEFGRRTFRWPVEPKEAVWARLEVWDVAADGAFTQPLWLR